MLIPNTKIPIGITYCRNSIEIEFIENPNNTFNILIIDRLKIPKNENDLNLKL